MGPMILRSRLDNIVIIYKNDNAKCLAKSRFKTDSNFDPNVLILTDPVSVQLLSDAIQFSTLWFTMFQRITFLLRIHTMWDHSTTR